MRIWYPEALKRLPACVSLAVAVWLVASCGPAPAPAPTAPPTAVPKAAPAPTQAPESKLAAPTAQPATAVPKPTAAPAVAKPAEKPYFEDKTIRIIAASGAGGGVDLVARFLATVMPKYIPGQPRIIVENMPGAGGVLAMNHVYNVAKPDGLTILAGVRGEPMMQLLNEPGVQYDVSKLKWLGSVNTVSNGIFVGSNLGAKSIADLQKLKQPVMAAALNRGDPFHMVFAMLEKAFGVPVKYLFGYQDSSSIPLGFSRGEVDGFGAAIRIMAGMEEVQTQMKAGKLLLIAQTGKQRDPLFANIPSVWEMLDLPGTSPNARAILDLLGLQDQTGKFYAVSPATPEPVLAILRKGFWDGIHDPDFASRVEKANQDYGPQSAEQVETFLKGVLNQTPENLELLRNITKSQ